MVVRVYRAGRPLRLGTWRLNHTVKVDGDLDGGFVQDGVAEIELSGAVAEDAGLVVEIFGADNESDGKAPEVLGRASLAGRSHVLVDLPLRDSISASERAQRLRIEREALQKERASIRAAVKDGNGAREADVAKFRDRVRKVRSSERRNATAPHNLESFKATFKRDLEVVATQFKKDTAPPPSVEHSGGETS